MANESELWLNNSNSSDDDYYIPFEDNHHQRHPVYYAVGSIFIIFIIVGVATNVLGLASLIRFRMWLKHEGYVYLVAMFAANIGILLFDSTTFCITHWNYRHFPPDSSEFMCRIWHFLMTIRNSIGWLSVALLFNVYLREHMTQRRRCGCPIFAAKFCTLFASKIIVGIIFGMVFILGLPYMGLFSLRDYGYAIYCSPHDFLHVYIVIYWVESGIMLVLPLVFFLPVILLLTLCMSREGDQFGFSGIEERSLATEQFRTVAVTLSSTNLFSHLLVNVGFAEFHHISVFLEFVITTIHMTICVSIGLQPVFCFIILKEFRIEILRKLRDLGCCKCLPQRFWPSGDTLRVRLQDVEEEDAEQQK